MPHTFDLRFARSAGLAALLEMPANRFRWKGAGRLSIDAGGISIALKRGFLTLLSSPRAQRIPAADLKEVYREGDELRVEFSSADTPRTVLPFWVRDRDTAASIVKLLPTTRTVEIEHSTIRDSQPRIDRRTVAVLAGVVLFGALGAWWLSRSLAPPLVLVSPPEIAVESPMTPATFAPAVKAPPAASTQKPGNSAEPWFIQPVPIDLAPPASLPLPRDAAPATPSVTPIPRSSLVYAVAKRETLEFAKVAAAVDVLYRADRTLLNAGNLSPEEYADKLDEYEMRWWNFTFRMLDDDAFAAPQARELRTTLLAAARHWRNFLHGYAEGLRARDSVRIAHSFDELSLAQELELRARDLIR